MKVLYLIILAVCSYLFGNINFAKIISKCKKDDITKHGSGNPGTLNMLRTFGFKWAIFNMTLEIFKGVVPTLVAKLVFKDMGISQIAVYVAGVSVILGHIYPVFSKFKGGKGVLVTSAMALILSPIPFVILLVLFVLIVWMSKYVSLGSVAVAALYPVVMHGTFAFMFNMPMDGMIALTTIVLACIIVWCHRKNLERISNRTESKISFKKKKDE